MLSSLIHDNVDLIFSEHEGHRLPSIFGSLGTRTCGWMKTRQMTFLRPSKASFTGVILERRSGLRWPTIVQTTL